jgi:hypothetical protein
MITLSIRYTIDAGKRADFEAYGAQCGGADRALWRQGGAVLRAHEVRRPHHNIALASSTSRASPFEQLREALAEGSGA